MCKIMGITNLTNIDLASATNIVGGIMSDQNDGFGTMVVNRDKSVYIQKTIENQYRFQFETTLDQYIKRDNTKNLVLGQLNDASSVFWHGRTSTNTLGMQNCHPITVSNWHVIHNGVVSNRGADHTRLVQTDTEHIAYYMSQNGISDVEKHLSGYYAFIAIDPAGLIHIVKDDIAPLVVAWCDSIDSYIFASNQNMIDAFCLKMGLTVGSINDVVENSYLVLDGNTLLQAQTITPRGYDYVESKWSTKSLGWNVKDMSHWDPYNDYVPDAYDATKWTKTDDLYSQVTDEYLDAIECVDASFEIYSQSGKKIKVGKFHRMQLKDKVKCTIVRYDGKVIDPFRKSS